jgi:hypothetical protein
MRCGRRGTAKLLNTQGCGVAILLPRCRTRRPGLLHGSYRGVFRPIRRVSVGQRFPIATVESFPTSLALVPRSGDLLRESRGSAEDDQVRRTGVTPERSSFLALHGGRPHDGSSRVRCTQAVTDGAHRDFWGTGRQP